MKKKKSQLAVRSEPLVRDIRALIAATRQQVAQVVNSSPTMLYWQVGRRVRFSTSSTIERQMSRP